jgi:hypothetical protein
MIKPIHRILLISLLLFSELFTFAQTNPLEKRATLQVQNEPLENVFTALTQQTGVRFSYNSQLINPKSKVTVNVQNKTIKEILPKIIPASVTYKKVGEHIVFLAKGEKEKGEREKGESEKGEKEKGEREARERENGNGRISPSNFEGVPEGRGSLFEEKNDSDNGKLMNDCLTDVSVAEDTLTLTKDTLSLTKEEEMKAQIAGILMAVATASAPVVAQDTTQIAEHSTQDSTSSQKPEKPLVPAQLTFIYPLGTGFVKSAEKSYHFSLNVLGGVIGQLRGFEAGSIFNINKYGAIGAQFAGVFNIAAACNPTLSSRNAQFAGVFNLTQKGKSAQFAGVFNIGDTAYFQAGGVFNMAHETGAQFAGVFNYADTARFQAAGVVNIAGEAPFQAAGVANVSSKTAFQAAGVANVSYQRAAFQAAGVVNVAQESVCQIAGVVNVTKKGRFQMGVINVRDTADGVSLGLINIVKHGGILEAGIEAGEFVHTAVTFRSGVQRLYSIISVGYNYTDNFWSVGYGLGTSFKLVGNLSLNLELTHATLYNHNWSNRYSSAGKALTQFTPMLNYRFAKHFKIYAGPSLNLLYQYDDYFSGYYKLKIPYSMYQHTFPSIATVSRTLDLWVGVVGGIKF